MIAELKVEYAEFYDILNAEVYFSLGSISEEQLRGNVQMAVSYKKLWKLLIDRDMKKKDLCKAAGISHASMAKLGKNENVTTDVLVKICGALKCDIGDIMEITEDAG